MNWNDLNTKEKEKWEKIAEDNQGLLVALKRLSETTQCFMCKAKFPDGLLNKNPGKAVPLLNMIRGDFLFHLQSTHGIEPAELKEIILKQ